jgi:hypothetical protein
MMRLILAAALAATLFAQNPGALTGTIRDPDGGAVPTADLQLTNTETNRVVTGRSSSNGTFNLSSLPPGTYDLLIPSLGFTFRRFERKGIAIAAGATVAVDVRLEWSGNLGTPGDELSIVVRDRSNAGTGPVPRTADGKPDLTGVWVGSNDPSPEQASMLPWAAALRNERAKNGFAENPGASCLPGDVLLVAPFIYKFVQAPKVIVQFWEGNVPGVRQIFMDGRPHPKDLEPTWMGHSTGSWDGDTLVVDNVGFNDKSWLGTYAHTEMLHVVQRYRRRDFGHLEVEVIVEDPGAFTKPYRIRGVWDLAPDEEIHEYICNENEKDVPHMVVK